MATRVTLYHNPTKRHKMTEEHGRGRVKKVSVLLKSYAGQLAAKVGENDEQ